MEAVGDLDGGQQSQQRIGTDRYAGLLCLSIAGAVKLTMRSLLPLT
jgi:hypothetical protein